ncbi:MAG: DUF6491 family protein [Oceanicaulis sp.]
MPLAHRIATPAFLSAAAVLALSACAGEPAMDEGGVEPQSFAGYEVDPRLGERVDRICFGASINGFGDTTDDTVLLEARVDDWYLAHTYSCPDLDHAQSLRFDRFGSCLRQGDEIIPYDSAFGDDTTGLGPRGCPIRAIYEWDPAATIEDGAS